MLGTHLERARDSRVGQEGGPGAASERHLSLQSHGLVSARVLTALRLAAPCRTSPSGFFQVVAGA